MRHWRGYRDVTVDLLAILLLGVVYWAFFASTVRAQSCPGGVCPSPGYSAPIYRQPVYSQPKMPSYREPARPRSTQHTDWPSVCRVTAGNGVGSGVYVDAGRAGPIVLTAAHVVRGEDTFVCSFMSPAQVIGGHVIARNDSLDIAAIRLMRAPRGIDPVAVATRAPVTGDKITLVGKGGPQRRGFIAHYGRFRGRATVSGGLRWHVDCPSSQGDSGGPAINSRGEVIGLVTNSNFSESTYCATVADWWSPWRRSLRKRVESLERAPPQYAQPQSDGPTLPNAALSNRVSSLESKVADLERYQAPSVLVDSEARAKAADAEDAAGKAVDAAEKAVTEATGLRGLIDRVKDRVDLASSDLVKIDGKIAGLVPIGDLRSTISDLRVERAKALEGTEGSIRDRLAADRQVVASLLAENKDSIRAKTLEVLQERQPEIQAALEEKLPAIPWGLILTGIGVATGGTGLGGIALARTLMKTGPVKDLELAVLGKIAEKASAADLTLAAGVLGKVTDRLAQTEATAANAATAASAAVAASQPVGPA